MKVTVLLLVTMLAVCAPALGFDLSRAEHLLRELRTLERLEHRAQPPRRVCSSEADVVFVLDRSRSIYPPDFDEGKVFVQNVIRLFDPTKSRFAAISFAEGATVDFDLGTYGTDQEATIKAIGELQQRPEIGGQTETWAALQLLYSKVLIRPSVRHGVIPTVVLITDGASQQTQRTADEAAKVHKMGIKIIAIGIGSAPKMSELNAIASDPDSVNVHLVENYREALAAIQDNIASEACPSNIENCDNNKPLDVMWSMSEHANKAEVSATFGLISQVMAKATMGPGSIQFGLARMDCGNSWAQISLNELDSVEGFTDEFNTRLSGFGNGLARRLAYLSKEAFKQGDQPNGNNVAIVFVDRKSDLDAVVRAEVAKMNGVHIIMVAGGDITAADVSGVANDVIFFSSYANIDSVAQDILDKLCKAEERSGVL